MTTAARCAAEIYILGMRRLILLLAFLMMGVAGCRSYNGTLDLGPEVSRAELMLLHNRERSKQGLEQLVIDVALQQRAQEHAEWMARQDSLTHSRLSLDNTSYFTMGENIAMGYTESDSVVQGWMNSTGHRRNILNKRFTHAGFGYARRPNGSPYWCTMFGGK